jgi:lipoprotein-releasing system ATP-binding protein
MHKENKVALQIVKGSQNAEPAGSGLRVIDLRKAFTSPAGERLEVLRGVELSIAPGEMIAITGVSGSGKSTLLQLLGGLDEPDHGTITLNEFVIKSTDGDLASFRRTNIGFVFQFHHLLADLTAAENVALPLMIARIPYNRARERANQMLKDVGLGSKCLDRIGHLSGGEQQRTAVARALIHNPRLILADEPTGNLDSSAGEEIAALLHSYARTRKAIVVLATHNSSVARVCDRILSIHDGKVI